MASSAGVCEWCRSVFKTFQTIARIIVFFSLFQESGEMLNSSSLELCGSIHLFSNSSNRIGWYDVLVFQFSFASIWNVSTIFLAKNGALHCFHCLSNFVCRFIIIWKLCLGSNLPLKNPKRLSLCASSFQTEHKRKNQIKRQSRREKRFVLYLFAVHFVCVWIVWCTSFFCSTFLPRSNFILLSELHSIVYR